MLTILESSRDKSRLWLVPSSAFLTSYTISLRRSKLKRRLVEAYTESPSQCVLTDLLASISPRSFKLHLRVILETIKLEGYGRLSPSPSQLCSTYRLYDPSETPTSHLLL